MRNSEIIPISQIILFYFCNYFLYQGHQFGSVHTVWLWPT